MVKRGGLYGDILHEVVEHNGTLYLAGVVAENGKLDMEGQAREVFQQIDRLLAANGSSREHVLTALIFITDMGQKPAMNRAWKAWLAPAHLPTRATIGVADLDGYLIEVVVTAAVR
ncbi:MAG: RidA family protein [Alphaproteobacteria bacterium]|nr:RidA family protein [Alphaproteobacteria bacterium]